MPSWNPKKEFEGLYRSFVYGWGTTNKPALFRKQRRHDLTIDCEKFPINTTATVSVLSRLNLHWFYLHCNRNLELDGVPRTQVEIFMDTAFSQMHVIEIYLGSLERKNYATCLPPQDVEGSNTFILAYIFFFFWQVTTSLIFLCTHIGDYKN